MCWEDLRDEEEYQLFRLPDGGTAELCKRCSTQVDYDTEATK